MTVPIRTLNGVYKGFVADNKDPKKQNRIKVSLQFFTTPKTTQKVPSTDWIDPVFPSGISLDSPAIGQGVWVLFKAGDPAYPVWIGEFGTNKGKNKKIYIKPLLDSISTTNVEDLLTIVSKTDGTKEVDLTSSLFNVINNRSYGSYYSTQTVAATTSNQIVPLDSTFIEYNGVSVTGGNTLKFSKTGVYYADFSFMFTSSNSSAKQIEAWLMKNGNPVTMSNSRITLSGNGTYGVLAASLMIEVTNTNDSWQFGWWGDNASVSLKTIAAANGRPGSPAVIVNVFKIK